MKSETMTDEQIAQAAQRHADELKVSSAIPGALVPMLHDIAKSSYVCGARDALRNQWVSVEERLPEDGQTVLTYNKTYDGFESMSWFEVLTFHKEYDGTRDCFESWGGNPQWPDYWMPIPAIPQSNPEKEER